MAFCTNCGNQMPDGTKFCTGCGAAMTNGGTQQQPQYAAPAPHLEEPISTGGYIGILLLMMIPLVNLVCLLVWACGGCKKENKKNLSRAMLILMLIGLLLGGIMFFAGSMLFGDVLGELGEALNS